MNFNLNVGFLCSLKDATYSLPGGHQGEFILVNGSRGLERSARVHKLSWGQKQEPRPLDSETKEEKTKMKYSGQ